MLLWLTLLAAVDFNRDVRPILSDRCFACHGPDAANRKTKMRLDTQAGAAGFILPGKPEDSPVIKRILSTNKTLRMPPAYAGHDRLSDREIAVLKEWIAAGAEYQKHWSFIPPKRPAYASIDDIVRARLAREGLKPAPRADAHTQLRRVSFDLTGLPPQSADAWNEDYAAAVDRLLASPQFGERMAIRWLDAARYSDTNGYQSDGVRDMWRWRDWVIDAFNHNKPFDQFTIEQIAGDLLPNATLDQKIATGFHRNHRTTAEGGIVDEEFRVEYLADRAETTSTVWLGLTMGCARCHDHKYDPMTQRDFYSLWAFFNNTPERGFVYNFGNEEPFLKAPTAAQKRELASLQAKVDVFQKAWDAAQPRLAREQAKWEKEIQNSPKPWVDPQDLVVNEPARQEFDGVREIKVEAPKAKFNHREPWTLSARIHAAPGAPAKMAILSRHEDYYEGQGYSVYLLDGKLRVHYTFRWTDLGMRFETKQKLAPGPHHIAVTYDGSMKVRDGHARIFVDGVEQELHILFDQNLWPLDHKATFRIGAGGGAPESNFRGVIEDVHVYARALTPAQVAMLADRTPLATLAAKNPKRRTALERDKLRAAFLAQAPPRELTDLASARAAYDKFLASVPTVMHMVENGPMPTRDSFILKRGAYDAHGDKVSPAVPHFLPGLPEGAPANRLGLAKWLVSRDNPLTARVTVNRIWQMFFGMGLVKTTEDFGSQGEWPIHPELLDWLAVDFMESGWDVKRLVRTIVMSETYRQSSRVTPDLLARDPDNRLFARGPHYRLPAEMIRDQALAVSGLLVPHIGGPPVKPYQPAGLWKELFGGADYKPDTGDGLYRRSLYTYWKRTVPPPFMTTFDAPMRETCVVRESRTNTPLQALNLMNDIQFVEAARVLAERILKEGGSSAGARVTFAYRTLFGREPSTAEMAAVTKLLDRFQGDYQRDPAAATQLVASGQAKRDPALDPREHAAYMAIASLLLNLDEAVTKE